MTRRPLAATVSVAVTISLAATLSLAILLAGCGGSSRPPPVTPAQAREWRSAAADVVGQLQQAVRHVQDAGVGRGALTGTSRLYEALLGWTYLRECSRLVGNLGPVPPALADVARRLERVCGELEKAASLFTSAVSSGDDRSLQRAITEAFAQTPELGEAGAALAPRGPGGGSG